MARFYNFFCFGMATVMLLACDDLDERAIDNKRIAQAIRDNKPQRINQKELLEWVKRKGTAWTLSAQKDFYRQVKRSLADSTLKKIQDFDTLENLPFVDSLIQQYQLGMKGYSFSKKYTLNEEVQAIFTSFQDKNASRDAITKQSQNKESVYFATPIVIDNETVGAWLITFPAKSARRWFDRKDLR